MKTLGRCNFLKLEAGHSELSRFCAVLICFFAFVFSPNARAQVATGFPPFSSIGGGPDRINEGNQNIHWGFPIISKAGRGLAFNYSLGFDNSVWKVVDDGAGDLSWQPMNDVFGWTRQTEAMSGYMTYDTFYGGPNCPLYLNFVYHDPSGTTHGPFLWNNGVLWVSPNHCEPQAFDSAIGTDGYGYQVLVVASSLSATVYPPSGGAINAPMGDQTGPTTIYDSNGNYISSGDGVTFTDTLGIWQMTIANSGTPYPTSYTYRIPGGSSATTNISYTGYPIQTNFGCSGIAEYSYPSVPLITSITYPDGSSYQLEYEDTPGFPGSKTGRLKSVTLPTGGKISYSYWGGDGALNGIFCDGTTAAFVRTVEDGSGSSPSSSTYIAQNADGTTTTHVTSPQGDETVINFSNGFETQRQIYQGPASSGTLLETILDCWNGVSSGTCGPGITVNPPIANHIKYTELPGTASRHDDYFDGNNNLIETDDYDWGYAFLRKKLITYATNVGNIVDHPASEIVEDGANPPNILSQTYFYYDQWPLWTPPGTTPQHGDPPQSQRGNLTEIQMWTGSSWLYHNIDYYDTGVVHDDRDVNGQPTYHNLADSTSSCGNAFPTSVTPPTGTSGVDLTTRATYDCFGGVVASTTDANGSSRSVVLDAMWRPTSVTDELGNVTHISYTKATPLPSFTPPFTESSFNFNGSISTEDIRTTLDGFGRTHIVQQKQSPTATNYDSVWTDYDVSGRIWHTSMPYVAAAGGSYPAGTPLTTSAYDALNRPKLVTDAGGGTVNYYYTDNNVLVDLGPLATGDNNTKRRQYQYDALGRLTSVCELANAAGNGNCGLNPAYWGFQTNYTYDTTVINSVPYSRMTVTQNAQQGAPGSQQTRNFIYDPLGRLAQETNPETGTTTYAYDSDSFCPNNPGDMVRRTDAMGAFTCYGFDALHRLWGVSHWGSGYGPSTASELFYYDSATVNGAAMTNAKGRLARAITCTSCSNPLTPITELDYGYSPRGETTDAYESTPHSNGYYHVNASYWPHGPLKTWTMPGVPMITYGATDGSGLDGEGRITKVTAASGQNPVTGVTYYNAGTAQPIGAPTQVNFGSSDYDQFSYDPNTGRLKQYTFNVNAQTDVGQLTWNANDSLQKLQITDSITGTQDSQTCTYSHDDLGRVASVNCNTPQNQPLWNQTFSYDTFGNISKNGTISWQPGPYPAATNQVPSSFGFTYDANGNTTFDWVHHYTWNAEGKLLSVSSSTFGGNPVNLTYDALGRRVEQQNGTSYQQVVYGPDGGKLALMNGQTLATAFVPLPGGATAIYNSSGLQYYRHTDHLGSSRLASTPARTLYYAGAYAPFGESYAETGTLDHSFTGQSQNTENGLLTDFMYREYSSAQVGRWISPDPAGLGAVNPLNPQTWNRYAYAGNSPLDSIDPLGLDYCDVGPTSDPDECKSWGGRWTSGGDGTFDCAMDGIPMPCPEALTAWKAGAADLKMTSWDPEDTHMRAYNYQYRPFWLHGPAGHCYTIYDAGAPYASSCDQVPGGNGQTFGNPTKNLPPAPQVNPGYDPNALLACNMSAFADAKSNLEKLDVQLLGPKSAGENSILAVLVSVVQLFRDPQMADPAPGMVLNGVNIWNFTRVVRVGMALKQQNDTCQLKYGFYHIQ